MTQTVVAWSLALLLGPVGSLTAQAMCGEDIDMKGKAASSAARAAALLADDWGVDAPGQSLAPMAQLTLLAGEALKRSALVGASRLLADAAADDVLEARGVELPKASLNGQVGPDHQSISTLTTDTKVLFKGVFSVTGVLYDAGRTKQLTQWKRELASAAQFSHQATREQVVLETVSNALERSRFRQQAQVYQQYARKMACLVDALGQIVAEDKGRASELVQARKTQAQAELARDQALTQGRTAELRLRRLVGDQVPLGNSITLPLTETLNAGEVIRLMAQSGELQQIRAQADASDRYAQAVDAGRKPELGWITSAQGVKRGDLTTSNVQAGLSITYSVFDGGAVQSAASAAAKRALAIRQQYEEVLGQRSSRVRETHEVATSSFDRARRYVDVLKDSDRVRSATFQQWSQLGRRSLFDVMSAESEHFNLRLAYVNSLHDGYQANAQLRSLGSGLSVWLNATPP